MTVDPGDPCRGPSSENPRIRRTRARPAPPHHRRPRPGCPVRARCQHDRPPPALRRPTAPLDSSPRSLLGDFASSREILFTGSSPLPIRVSSQRSQPTFPAATSLPDVLLCVSSGSRSRSRTPSPRIGRGVRVLLQKCPENFCGRGGKNKDCTLASLRSTGRHQPPGISRFFEPCQRKAD